MKIKKGSLNFSIEEMVEMFGWQFFWGFTAATCGTCEATANVPCGWGWFCECGAFNRLPWHGAWIPWDNPMYGPTREDIVIAVGKNRVAEAVENGIPIFLILKNEWQIVDFANLNGGEKSIIAAGCHEMERVPHPTMPGIYCLVLKGTRKGATEGFWFQFIDGVGRSEVRLDIKDMRSTFCRQKTKKR